MAPRTDVRDGAAASDAHHGESAASALVPLRVRVEASGSDAVDHAREVELQFQCDWDIGIGGSVWTSGEILTSHLEAEQRNYRAVFKAKVVVELGSGTGYVGLMTAVCFEPSQVILTDLASHVECMQRNVDSNAEHVKGNVKVGVAELSWGVDDHEGALLRSLAETSQQVDIILGTDVAYLRELYEPLLHTLRRIAHDHTLILFGMNRTDTDTTFFRRLEEDGFEYYKISDHRLPSAYRGKDFGLFEIKRRRATGCIISMTA